MASRKSMTVMLPMSTVDEVIDRTITTASTSKGSR
jgi:hypothetical protein